MSAQWPTVGTDAPPRPALPPGTVAQANGAPASTAPTTLTPAAAAQLQARILAAQAASSGVDQKPIIMSNGVVAPSALAAPQGSINPLSLAPRPPPVAVALPSPTVNQNGKRELSPDRAVGMPPQKTIKSTHGEDVKRSGSAPSDTTGGRHPRQSITPTVAVTAPPAAMPVAAVVAAPAASPVAIPVAASVTTPGAAPVTIPVAAPAPASAPPPVSTPVPVAVPSAAQAPAPAAVTPAAASPAPATPATATTTPAPSSAAPAGSAAVRLPMGRGQGIDLRAEEEAARRAFARSAVGNVRFAGNASRARQTDLFGEPVLRARLNQIAQQHGMTVDDEAMRYLALAAEIRVRALLSSAARAQHHRVSSTHAHKPPMSKASGSKPAKPLWSQKITSDPHAVMAALANANRDENKAHRVARTERNARETEMARAEAVQRERERERDGGSPPPAADAPPAASGEPASESDGPTTSPAPAKPKEPTFQSAPTFGAPPVAKKSGKGKKAASNVSADMQAKMTNATAMMAAGGRKRYAWETGAMGSAFRPQVSSLLSGKRKKGGEEEEQKEESGGAGGAAGAGGAGDGSAAAAAPAEEAPRPPKRPKRSVTGPHRRQVDIETPGDKKGRDDTALTAVDVLFALEHEGSGRGMGTADEIIQRVNSRPGGPYGKW